MRRILFAGACVNNTGRSFHVDDSSLSIYLRQISRYRPLSSREEFETAQLIHQGDRKALDRMVKANLRFVVSVSRNYLHQGMSLADLINEGNIGLVKAARRFDECKNFRFISYAVWWIRQSILQSLANQSRFLRVPLNRVAAIQRAGKVHARLEQRLRRAPNNDEVAQELKTSSDDVLHMQRVASTHASLDAPSRGIKGATLLDSVWLPEQDGSEDGSSDSSPRGEIALLLEQLNGREAQVLSLYYGLHDGVIHTLDEIAGRLGITRERVRQIRESAIERLRRAFPRTTADVTG